MPKPDAPRLHLNANLSQRLAIQLRGYGFDVTSSQELRIADEADDLQLAFAASERRAILTFNVKHLPRCTTCIWSKVGNTGESSSQTSNPLEH